MSCKLNINIDDYPSLKGLHDFCGTNISQFYNYLTNVIHLIDDKGTIDFTDEFKQEWAKNKRNGELSFTITDSSKLKDKIIDFYKQSYPSSTDFNREGKSVDKAKTFGYTSVAAREEGKIHFVDAMISWFHQNENYGTEKVKKNLKAYYCKKAIDSMNVGLAKQLSAITDIPAAEILKNLTDNNLPYIESILKGHEDKVSIQLQNRIALYTEYSSNDLYKSFGKENTTSIPSVNPRLEFINEIMTNSNLDQIRIDKDIELNDDSLKIQIEENTKLEGKDLYADSFLNDSDTDNSIGVANSHYGEYSDFMTHIGAPIRALLGSLRQMTIVDNNNTSQIVMDTDNYFGIPLCMNANLCASVLYHYGKYDSIAIMMQSIKDISEQLPGFAAFSQLYNHLNKNKNLQYYFYRTFKKLSISKVETAVENGQVSINYTNNSNDTQVVLYYKFINAFKGTALTNTLDYNDEQRRKLKLAYNAFNLNNDPNGVKIRKLATDIATFLQAYFPSINDISIRNFILYGQDANGKIDPKANLALFFNEGGIIDAIINASNKTRYNYAERQSEIRAALRHNFKERDNARLEQRTVNDKKLIDLAPLYSASYLTDEAESIATSLSKLLAPFTVVNSSLNSRDCYGHQSSDIINDSMVTNIIKTLESQLNTFTEDNKGNKVWNPQAPLIRLAEHRSQSRQYDFSNILIEHTDEKGHIINQGLFRKDKNGTWIPTEYATNLLKVSQYNGASNRDYGDNSSYADMSHGDYLSSAWKNFFNASASDRAGYFMRIPSDAPKTFIVEAPRTSAAGFLIEANKEQINSEIKSLIDTAASKVVTDMNMITFNQKPILVFDGSKTGNNTEAFVKHIQATPNNAVDIKIPRQRLRYLHNDKDHNVRLAFRYKIATSENNQNVYVMEGTYYDGVLHNASFVGFAQDSINDDIWKNVRKTIKKAKSKLSPEQGGIQWTIDTNHVLYKQLYNTFYQELVDMVTAGTVIFKTNKDKNKKGYSYFTFNSKTHAPLMNKGFTNTEHNGLHPTYHFKDHDTNPDKRTIYEIKDGKIILNGKVFHSDRFVVYNSIEDVDNNFGEKILNEAFRFFYGGANANYLRFKEDKNGITIDITDEQKAIIEKHITDFVLAYVEEAREEMNNIANLDNADNFTSENLAEFVLNNHLTYIGFNDLFEGDTKFYKNTQTFLKRAKEVQGSGVPYGMADFTRSIQSEHLKIDSPLTGVKFFGNKEVQMYDGFSAITVYNTIHTDTPMLECLIKQLTSKKVMGDKVLSEENARKLLYGPKGDAGYQDTTVNDAQSYITFDEWIRRIAGRGKLDQYKDLIDRVLDESKPLDVHDIEELIQVQKNFYYDQYYNADTKIISPRQIKNAEFVLIPRLVRGTELEQIAKLMDKLGIDQLNTVETSKSGQGTRFTIWDHSGNLTQEMREDLEHVDEDNYDWKSELMIASQRDDTKKQFKEYFNYNYLYTQQETPQHLGADAKNKAGIQIMKKIIDNIDENAPVELKEAKRRYFELYSKNIQASFDNLMTRLNVKIENGSIKIVNGEIEGLDHQQLYNMLKDELVRLGMDSNALDYCTVDESSPFAKTAVMPSGMSFIGPKFENIVQSLFNRNITRQLLPGFHAAQVTGIGFQVFSNTVEKGISSTKYGRTSNPLKYHYIINEQNGEYEYSEFVEIMLPCSAFGLNRNDKRYAGLSREEQNKKMLQDLHDAGLDTLIGYRIPTEGKQSICYMKIADFTDEAYGSTIVVPDAWVSQTGADFDIDSVYGIQFKSYKDKEGKLHKIEYHDSKYFEDNGEKAWYDYIARSINGYIPMLQEGEFDKIKDTAKVAAKKGAKEAIIAAKNSITFAEQSAFENLPKAAKQVIRGVHEIIHNEYGTKLTAEQYKDQLGTEIYNLQELIKAIQNGEINSISKEDTGAINAINEYIAINYTILDPSSSSVDTSDIYKSIKSEAIKKAIDKARDEQRKAYETIAKEKGLLSKEDFIKQAITNPDDFNSVDARSNEMISQMMTMLIHPYSLEENLSRSNFDDILEALKKYNSSNKVRAAKRAARSPYNIFSQAYYQEDAMSGAKLKGISVVRDTFCSVMNTVKPAIPSSAVIRIAYPKNKYSETELIKRFNKVDNDPNSDVYIVTHDTFGWTKDNKNIDGKILTSYSSQTTAHILDAMKAGNVPNVNEYTFQVYKTFVDMGSNYDTAISFIMQPGITKLVEAYNNTNSIYSSERSKDFVKQAIRAICDELSIEYDYSTSTNELINAIEKQYGDAFRIMNIFGKTFEFSLEENVNAAFALNSLVQGDRIAEKGLFEGDSSSPVENINAITDDGQILTVGELRSLYDLATILQFDKINKLVDDVRSAAMVLNPDKFGAKQTIFATRQIFDNIVESVQNNATEKNGTQFRLQSNNKHIIETIYPGIINENTETVDDIINNIMNNDKFVSGSKYPFLASFLKYATVPSIVVNQTLFETQQDIFRDLILDRTFGLASALSGDNKVNESMAKDFQNYLVNYITLHRSRFLQAPLGYNMGKGGARGFTYSNYQINGYNQNEADRVTGFGYPVSISNIVDGEEKLFIVTDILNLTQIEVDNFAALTPAQKIAWIQKYFSDAPLFNYIDINLYNELAIKQGKGSQTIEFNEDSADIETVYNEFEKAFTNKHPFIALAAADIVKYAFYVEGYRIGMGNVSKMIKNSVFTTNNKLYGTGIVADYRSSFSTLSSIFTNNTESNDDLSINEQLVENYIRGHYQNTGIEYHRVAYVNKHFELSTENNGLIYLNLNDNESQSLAAKYGITYEDNGGYQEANKYVRLGFNNNEILYRIKEYNFNDNRIITLIPLNPLFANENTKWSSIETNNNFNEPAYYINILNKYFEAMADNSAVYSGYSAATMRDSTKKVDNDGNDYKSPNYKKREETRPIPIKNINTNPSFKAVIDAIQKWYPTYIIDGKPVTYIWNNPLSKHIKAFGKEGEDIYTIKLADGSRHNFKFIKTSVKPYIKKYLGQNYNKPVSKKDEALAELIDIIRVAASYDPNHTLPSSFGEIFTIVPVDSDFATNENEQFSVTLDKAVVQMADSIDTIARADDTDYTANQLSMRFKDKGVIHTVKEIAPYSEEIIVNVSKYLSNTVERLMDKYEHYFPKEDGNGFYSINDIETIERVKANPVELRQYIKDILEPQRLIGQFGLIKDFDITAEDPNLEPYLKKLKKAIHDLEDSSKIKDAFEKLAKEYYDASSNAPLIRAGMVSVLDGYYKTNWLNAMFNDIQETSNPIVQIALKNFQADFRKKEFQAREEAREFEKHMNDIISRAKVAGKNVDFNNIIDEYGRFKQRYNQQFIDDRNRLLRKHKEALKEFGRGSIEELEARLEYDEWKAKHLEQRLVKAYYDEKNAVLRKALYGVEVEDPVTHKKELIGKCPELVSLYEQLREKRKDLRAKYQPDVENVELDEEMDELTGEMNQLSSLYEDDGRTPKKDRTSFNYETATPQERIEYARHSKTQAERLKEYLNGNRQIERQYYKYDPHSDFETLVEKNLKIVASFESSNEPASFYLDNPNYVKAKTWLRQNAELTPVRSSELEDKIREAFEAIMTEKVLSIRSEMLHNKEYRGIDGKFDPRLIPAEEIEKLKEEEIKVNGFSAGPLSDKTIISNSEPNGKVYKASFYNGMHSNKSKSDNPRWQKTVKKLNSLLSPYYNEFTQTVEFSEIPNTPEGLKILQDIKECYDALDEIRGPKKSKGVIKFIEKYVDTEAYNELKYNADIAYVKGLPYGKFRRAMLDIVKRETYDGKIKPNSYLYGFIKPKAEFESEFIDEEKTKALKVLEANYEMKVRPEFRDKQAEMYAQSKRNNDNSYAEWYDANTVYDPYTHTVKPLSIWMIRTPKADKFEYYPKFPQTERVPRDGTFTKKELKDEDFIYDLIGDDIDEVLKDEDSRKNHYIKELDYRNKKWNPNGGFIGNFRATNNDTYNTSVNMNEFEVEAMNYMQNILNGWTRTKQGKYYLNQGYLPARVDNSLTSSNKLIKEIAKVAGFVEEEYDPSNWYDIIDYSKDKPHTMPMLVRLTGKNEEEIGKKPIKGEQGHEDESNEEYNERVKAWSERKNKILLDTHKRLLDRDWINVIQDFIIQAGRYNAVQDNKYELFFARTLLKNYGHYIATYNKQGKKYYKKNFSTSNDERSEYQRTPDENLIQQFDNQIKRLVYNQYKSRNNPTLMKWMSVLQSVTSSQYMMMNVKGGIANVTLGESSIMQEVFGKEYFNLKEWGKGKALYSSGMLDYLAQATGRAPQTLAGSIIAFMDIVDYDEHTGVSRLSKDAYVALKKFRNFNYTPQTAGEHEMQNSAMFSLMHSHRIFEDANRAKLGKAPYVIKSFNDYIMDAREDALLAILSDEETELYNKFKEKVSSDANDFRDYAHYKKDVTTIFAIQKLSKEKQKEVINKLDEITKKAEKEFYDDKKHPTVISQLSKGEDGVLTFKKDSILYNLHQLKDNDGISYAYGLLAEFKGKAISVNKYIHGAYDKSGRAQFEKTWIGSLFMQYHKHLPIGIMKRYRTEGMFNEERGTIQKGMYRSIYDFLSIPFKKDQVLAGLTNENVEALKGFQNVLKDYVDLVLRCNTYYHLMPEYDKANIRRSMSNFAMIFSAVAATIAIKAGWDDDDSLLYNLAIYETDRFATEAAQYFPIVAWGEGKKLYKSPIAAGSGITDALASVNLLCHMIIDGDEFDGEYHSGKFAGEDKLTVYLRRRIPIWRGIESSFIDIQSNNQYYKTSENILGFLNVDKIAKDIKK